MAKAKSKSARDLKIYASLQENFAEGLRFRKKFC